MLKPKLNVLILISLVLISLLFLTSKNIPEKTELQPVHYYGAVLPHHLLAKDLMDDFLSKITYSPEKIYVIGPNHQEIGNAMVITNQNSETDRLLKLNFIRSEHQITSVEHSVKVFQDIFSEKYPGSQIIPLVISSKLSTSDLEKLVDYLSKNSSDKTLIICSTDFSHYKTLNEANDFDQKSLEAITQKKYSEIFSFNNDYIDSPKSLIIFLKTLSNLNKDKLTVLNHSNSAIINHDINNPSTTSYYELAFE